MTDARWLMVVFCCPSCSPNFRVNSRGCSKETLESLDIHLLLGSPDSLPLESNKLQPNLHHLLWGKNWCDLMAIIVDCMMLVCHDALLIVKSDGVDGDDEEYATIFFKRDTLLWTNKRAGDFLFKFVLFKICIQNLYSKSVFKIRFQSAFNPLCF